MKHQQETPGWHEMPLEPGCLLVWDGEIWELVNPGDLYIKVRHVESQQIQDIPCAEFEQDLVSGRIKVDPRTQVEITMHPIATPIVKTTNWQ